MKVIMINEENHGFLGLAKDYRAAVTYLYKNNWLEDFYSLEETETTFKNLSLTDKLGPNWLDVIYSWTRYEFNYFFEDAFYLQEIEVFE